MKSFKHLPSGFLYSAILVIALPLAAEEQPHRAPAIVTRYCSGCHGVDGNSELPYIPRVAGLDAAYTRQKLAGFKAASQSPVDEIFTLPSLRRSKTNARVTSEANVHMVGVSHSLSEAEIEAATRWYAAQRPSPRPGGTRVNADQGRSLFLDGMTSQSIPACQTCHGPDGNGGAKAPRLAGQNAAYIVRQLAFLGRAGADSGSPMTDIARHIDRDQARNVAAYLQSH